MSGTTSSTAAPASTNQSRQDSPPLPPWLRQFKQLGLFFAGAGFMAASVAVSRRAVLRRQLDSFPKFYSSNRAPIKFDSADRSALAAQALSLATLNVMSFGIMLVGGLSWGFDLCSVEELRARTQAATQRPGLIDAEGEAQMEELMNDLMARLGMEKPASSGKEEEKKKD